MKLNEPTESGVQLLKVLSDKTRIAVIEQLFQSPKFVCELNDKLQLEQSLLSQHLRTLRDSGIVETERKGKNIQYSLSKSFKKNKEGRSLDLGCCELKFKDATLENKLPRKFQDPDVTAKGEARAWVNPVKLKTIWFNTGTLCNLECKGCYMESSPKNDRLVYITSAEVIKYLDEIESENLGTKEIAFTGGEPFMNKDMIPILEACHERGYETLTLTNAMKPMNKYKDELLKLKNKYGSKLKIRVSIDHYLEEKHAEERGDKAWAPAIKGLQWLSQNSFNFSIAGRTYWGETEGDMRKGYSQFFNENQISLDAHSSDRLVLFPEMDDNSDVPEITTKCWDILGLNPKDIMCATSRMIVKRRGQQAPTVLACTLLPYDRRFEMGQTLKESFKAVKLNHPHCAKFCVLGGGSCSKN